MTTCGLRLRVLLIALLAMVPAASQTAESPTSISGQTRRS